MAKANHCERKPTLYFWNKKERIANREETMTKQGYISS